MKSTKNIIPILLKNTLTNKKDVFISRKKNTVTMYNCGPTVQLFMTTRISAIYARMCLLIH